MPVIHSSSHSAKRYNFSVLGAVADSFLSRQGEINGSPKLSAIINQVAKADGSLAYRVVTAASKLSYPGNPPIEEIKALAESMDRNDFGFKLSGTYFSLSANA